MMRIKEISVSFKYTKNMGNYESMVAEAGVTIEISDTDDIGRVYNTAWGIVENQVKNQIETKGGNN